MSEEINLEPSNLCTTEDAFEQFQASSKFGEDEYITLADIVPPQPEVPDLTSELNEIPYSNEVVLSANNNCDSQDVNITIELYSDEKNEAVNRISTISGHSNTKLSGAAVEDSSNQHDIKTKRRGRKRKTFCETNDKSYQDDTKSHDTEEYLNGTQENATHSQSLIQDSILSTTHGKKRGRQPKKIVHNIEVSPVLPRRTHRERIPNISKYPLTSESENSDAVMNKVKKTAGRRGRPKKKPQQDQTAFEADSTNLDNFASMDRLSDTEKTGENDASLCESSKRGTGRRGRQKKAPLEVKQNQIDQKVADTSSNNIDNIENATTDSSLTDVDKRLDRKGRQKKLPQEIHSTAQEVGTEQSVGDNIGSSEKSYSEDDEMDDISLSNLSKRDIKNPSVNEVEPEFDLQTEYLKEVNPDIVDTKNTSLNKLKSLINKFSNKKVNKRGREKVTPVESKNLTIENTNTTLEKKTVEDDEADNICLSKLKETIEPNITTEKIQSNNTKDNLKTETQQSLHYIEDTKCDKSESSNKRNSKMPIMSDFEYNIDSIVSEAIGEDVNKGCEEGIQNDNNDSLLIEDTSKRPIRRKVKQTLHYDEGSDEDPFANVELSDDEPRQNKKGTRYYSDDEYVPGKKRGKFLSSSSDDSDLKDQVDLLIKQRRKKTRKRSDNQSPKKRGKKCEIENVTNTTDVSLDVTSVKPDEECQQVDDIEVCLEPSVIKASDESPQKKPLHAWGISNEFENFLAKKIQGTNLKIKKVSEKRDSSLTPLEIPVINPSEAKRTVETSSQTVIRTDSIGVQTATPHEVVMKTKAILTSEQSQKACEFLNSIVTTTAELGQLMTQKSEDFIKKKINTEHVTDTFKMDYCVKKSFLLFKLAKHNLMQMEEDLAKQYDEFLKTNNLSSCREEPKKLAPTVKAEGNDSDCEIVEVPVTTTKRQEKPKFNPKTVFLNKELSIKIAKKPSEDKKLNIKGRHTVWINDSVMVKKVTPTQSFLAQDSRNKKPPDNFITEKMVSDFFKDYYRRKADFICAPFTSTDWLNVDKDYICSYFVVNSNESAGATIPQSGECSVENDTVSDANCNFSVMKSIDKNIENSCPKKLFTLCTEALVYHLHLSKSKTEKLSDHICDNLRDRDNKSEPVTLFQLCVKTLTCDMNEPNNVVPLKKSQYYEKTSSITNKKEPITLFHLCVNALTYDVINMHIEMSNLKDTYDVSSSTVQSLKKLSHRKIVELLSVENPSNKHSEKELEKSNIKTTPTVEKFKTEYKVTEKEIPDNMGTEPIFVYKNCVKTLFSLCTELIQNNQKMQASSIININSKLPTTTVYTPNSLKDIVFKSIKPIMYGNSWNNADENGDEAVTSVLTNSDDNIDTIQHPNQLAEDNFTINCVNTMSEEAFFNIVESSDAQENSLYLEDIEDEEDCYNDNEFEPDSYNFVEDNLTEEASWVSQVQMKELKSCLVTSSAIQDNHQECLQEETIAQIKIEPLEEMSVNIDSSIVKTEPVHGLDEMTIIPESIITKPEITENSNIIASPIQNYDVNYFEDFVGQRMMHELNECNTDEVFSQCGLRIRRQHEPDYEEENDTSMSLLVPQTYEPLHIETAKGRLMESSSDEGTTKKSTGKKKTEKRRGKSKKSDTKTNNKDIPIKEKPAINNEVAVLTRRMRERIRQEEKKICSSDSEEENLSLSLRKDKTNKKENNNKVKSSKGNKTVDDEIQCNNVDSTEQVSENVNENVTPSNNIEETPSFTGFSAIDQNEISTYQKYMKYVYDKIIPKVTTEDRNEAQSGNKAIENSHINDECIPDVNDTSSSSVVNPNQPVELLQCEPSMPLFEDNIVESKSMKKSNDFKKIALKNKDKNEEEEIKKNQAICIERHGWKCYPIDTDDTKLYQDVQINLEKLPESFVETYFRYQDITDKDREDHEVDRLINLQSLKRISTIKDSKENKTRSGQKSKVNADEQNETGQNSDDESRTVSAVNSDCYDELTPSEDEGTKVDDEIPPPVPLRSSENCLAKNFLMDDNDSDPDIRGSKKIKEEPIDDAHISEKSRRPGPKSKTRLEEKRSENSESLMLTADKMMNKELTLLHAPIFLNEVTKTPSTVPSHNTRLKQKSATKAYQTRERSKPDDDSSSEEEKQWVSTKEKLLKRMGKKDDASVDDAKRAKLVSEFIERRGDAPETRARRGKGRRSKKKLLERQKQLRVLSKELFGENPIDAAHSGKRSAQAYFKGRRNIRKVIDKTSLATSTVVANMEEFERKRRLNIKQNRLRELLGCDEGVNVLVINDEVCLEYDFDRQRPIVTVHSFFTKVMKAHQYEGVKFMWDACFESLSTIEAGHPGGGCILAHCMGLGKTLQVLALLHTVLTHPHVGMQRVLVCCPLSTVLNWVDEIHKWIGPVTDQIKVFELSKLRKTYERAYQLEDWYSGGGIFIIGYELFRSLTTLDPLIDDIRPTIVNKIRTALLDPGPDIIVCDEGHLLKNDCSVLAVAMSRVVTKRRIVLTGTPMQNNLREYYCMVNFVKPNLLGKYSEYSNRFENPIMNGQHRDSREEDIKLMKARTHILHKVLEGCLQRQEASVLYPYLPKKHEYTVFISLTQCQWNLYKHYLHNYGKQTKQSILKDFHILQKIWSHPQVLHNFQMRSRDETRRKVKAEKNMEDDLAHEDLISEDIKPPDTEVWWLQYLDGGNMLDSLDSSNKFAAVFRILEECIALGDKVLIFSTSLFTLDALEFFLKKINKWSLGQEYYRLDGSVPAEVRQKWCREFNADNNHKTKLFLISTRAGCLGLNMTAANRVIILDTSWNPAHDIQSIFRVYRFGQKKDCYIYRLVAMGTMEQKIYERSVTKQAVACRVVDEQQIDRHYNMAELTELYRFDEAGASVAGGVAVGVEDVALLRVARLAALHAVHEHDSLLRGSSEQNLPEHERAAAWMQFQQEHAHKQMQNDLDANRAEKALKLQQERELAEQNNKVIKIENKNDDEYILPSELKIDLKSKRGRKPTIVNCRIPIHSDAEQAGTSKDITINRSDEDIIVKKITDILLKYNFQNRQGTKEISDLMKNVRSMVATGQPMTVTPGTSNELTASIANVLLERENMTMPALTDIMCESINKSVTSDINEPETRKGRRREDKTKDVPTKSAEESTGIETDTSGRKKRKAALVAEKNFDSLSQDSIIELDDDEWHNSDTDTAPDNDETILEEPKKTMNKNISKTQILKQSIEKENTLTKEIQAIDNSSIVLSDDDEPPKTPVNKEVQKEMETPKEVVQDNPEEAIPLHPSLLTNTNFIKIVAHTYLEGNPMLDEDAATLAARYSTYKALKEAEATGKNIDSGPIYDIAVKILGIDIMKKLYKTNAKENTKELSGKTTAATPKPSNESMQKPEPTPAPPEKKAPAKPKPIVVRKLPNLLRREVPKRDVVSAPAPQPPASNVVPVGLIQRVVNIPANTTQQPSRDECILPDDDEVRIVNTTLPTTPTIPSAQMLNTLSRRNSKPLAVSNVVARVEGAPANPPSSAPPNALQPFIKIAAGRIITLGSTASPSSQNTTPARTAQFNSDDTICLDSDDEDAARPQLVPVSLLGPGGTPIALPQSGPGPHLLPLSLAGRSTQTVPPSMPELGSRVVPMTSSGPTPVPISLTGPGSQPVTLSAPGLGSQPVTLSVPGLGSQPVTLAVPGLGSQSGPTSVSGAGPRPVALSGPGLPVVPVSLTAVRPHGLSGPVTVSLPGPVTGPLPGPVTMPLPGSGQLLAGKNSTIRPVGKMTRIPASAVPLGAIIRPTGPSSQLPGVGPTNTPHEAAAPVPSQPPPISPSVPTGVLNKTLCRPGDILRITKTGQLEILARPDDEPGPAARKTSRASDSLGLVADKTNTVVPKPVETEPAETSAPKITLEEDSPRPSRRRPPSVSSVSSSSASSRSSSPNDPLAILKDVVHIQAYDAGDKSKSNASQSNFNNGGSTRKSSNLPSRTPIVLSRSAVKAEPAQHSLASKSMAKSSRPSTSGNTVMPAKAPTAILKPSTSFKDMAEKQVDKTNNIIRKLKHLLGPSNKSQNNSKTSKNTIDLTRIVEPDKKPSSVAKRKTYGTQTKERKTTNPSKVVGTTKNIIFDGKSKTLKTTTPSVDLTGQKSINITNMKSIPVRVAAHTDKKRPSTSTDTGVVKKKKTEQMTLKDFDIDDIDDIIELD